MAVHLANSKVSVEKSSTRDDGSIGISNSKLKEKK